MRILRGNEPGVRGHMRPLRKAAARWDTGFTPVRPRIASAGRAGGSSGHVPEVP